MIKKCFTWKNFFQSHLFFVVGLVMLALLSINFTKTQLKDRSIREEIASLQDEVESLEQERTQYEGLLKLFDTPVFLEMEARRSLGYVKPGEKVVVIEKRNSEGAAELAEKKISNPIKWWIYFFGKI